MTRADLHYALAVDSEIFEASQIDSSLLDPVVRVQGGLPGQARPFVVVRDYQGPQGAYTEYFVIRDADGNEVARSNLRLVELEGEMFENRFTTTLERVEFNHRGEHELVFFLQDEEIGSVPVFIESGYGGDPRIALEETFKKAVGKGEIIWLSVPQPPGRKGAAATHTQPVWFVYSDGKLYVLSGPGEQDVPHLAEAQTVEITARSKDLRSRVARIPAAVRLVAAGTEEYQAIAEKMLSGRLNLPDGDAALDRWKRDCVMVELTPDFGEPRPAAGAA